VTIKGDPSNAFMWSTVPVHRTGAATTDQDMERVLQLQAIRVLAEHQALDLLDMIFRPPREIQRQSTGRVTEGE
jgi:hypothetical protein